MDGQQVGDARLALGIGDDLAAGVGDRRADLLRRHRGVVEQDDAAGRRQALAHLLVRRLQVEDLRRTRGDLRLRDGERLAVAAVEAGGQVAGELEVLALVLTDRHLVGLVDEDVGGLQHRVGEQARPTPRGALALALVLELGHPAGLAEAGQALQHPRELQVLGHVALHEQGAALTGPRRARAAGRR